MKLFFSLQRLFADAGMLWGVLRCLVFRDLVPRDICGPYAGGGAIVHVSVGVSPYFVLEERRREHRTQKTRKNRSLYYSICKSLKKSICR